MTVQIPDDVEATTTRCAAHSAASARAVVLVLMPYNVQASTTRDMVDHARWCMRCDDILDEVLDNLQSAVSSCGVQVVHCHGLLTLVLHNGLDDVQKASPRGDVGCCCSAPRWLI